MATVTLRQLTKRFADTAAVQDLNLEIGDGEFVSLLGPSGCGKTTTLRLIAGFLQPEAGEIRVNQQVVSSPSFVVPPERRNMSMIFQSYAVWPHMTVFHNVAYGLKFQKLPRPEAEKKVEKVLSLVHLERFRGRYPGELSGGQQQRIALARALVVEPQILLLDEPLSNLDANLREEMRFEIRRLHEEFRITTVYVTHDQAEAMVTSDRIAVMSQGKVIQVGTPEEIFERPKTTFVAEFIGRTNILEGTWEGGGKVALGGDLVVRVAGGEGRRPGTAVSLCVRPHIVSLVGSPSEADERARMGYNIFPGVIRRRIYFGDTFDYVIGLPTRGLTLRVVAAPFQRYDLGQKVFALVRPEHCVIVGEG